MSDCLGKISKSFLRDCNYRPKANLKTTCYLINTEDIDKATTQLSSNKMSITDFVLNAGKVVYPAEGAGKYPQANTEIVKGDNGNGWKHGHTLRIIYYGEDEREQLQEMLDDGRITTVIEKNDGGLAGELTFEVLGFESGMAVQSVTWNSNENDGVVEIVLGTEEDELEGTDRKVFMDTDLATTRTWLTTNAYDASPV